MLSIIVKNLKLQKFHYFFDSGFCIKFIVILTILSVRQNNLVNGLRGNLNGTTASSSQQITTNGNSLKNNSNSTFMLMNNVKRRNTNMYFHSTNTNNNNKDDETDEIDNVSFNNNNNNKSNSNKNNNPSVHSISIFNNNNNNNNNNNIFNKNLNNIANIMTDSSSSCQTVCVCKWKGGKQTVECIDRSLITLPEIDQSTQVLDMSGNNLQILPHEQFKKANLLNLQKLYLRNCRIGQIEIDAFKGLTNLVELDLSQNLLTSVPSQTLIYTPSLRDLILASNPIQKIDGYTFRNIPSLHKLDLSHCEIQSIAPQAFEGLDSLLMLKLNGNKLSELRPRTVETLSKLHGVELHDNPWMCDCRLRAAKLWLTEKNIPYPVSPICSGGPERVIDRTFADLQVDDFACKPEILPTSRYVESTTGENATIVCRTSAIPSANVNWYWNGRQLANGSVFSSYQRVFLFDEGIFDKRSKLVLTNAQEIDSSEFYCVAENRAGTAEANFTLHVSMRAAGMASLGSGQIVGLSAALVILILFILIIILFLLTRLRRTPFVESKTPNHIEVIATSVNQQNSANCKQPPPSSNSMSTMKTGNGGIPNSIDTIDGEHQKNHHMLQQMSSNESNHTNPVQKPPRLTDLPYGSSNNCDNSMALSSQSGCFVSPTASAGNNPDLINDTKRYGSGDFSDLKIPPVLTTITPSAAALAAAIERPDSGEYSRAGGCDSLYPSGLWETVTASQTSSPHPHHIDDLFLKRATSTTIAGYSSYADTTPIIDSIQLYDLQERIAATNEFFSKTFPRTHFGTLTGSSTTIVGGTNDVSSLGFNAANSVASTTTTLSSSIGGGIGGYPSDYGLPLVPGAEQQLQLHHPLHYQQQQQQQQQQHNPFYNNNNNSSYNGNNNNHTNVSTNNNRITSNNVSNSSSNTTTNNINSNNSNNGTMVAASSSVTSSPGGASITSTSMLPNGMPINAKTIRVWQKGGVPVLPPVTALKRALTSSSRNSPDEGYQEGCGTDV